MAFACMPHDSSRSVVALAAVALSSASHQQASICAHTPELSTYQQPRRACPSTQDEVLDSTNQSIVNHSKHCELFRTSEVFGHGDGRGARGDHGEVEGGAVAGLGVDGDVTAHQR